ncbi:hypothetical protein NO263_09130 [Gluconacetobacter entanii]|uniref:UrcA family protein n=1 Tax=Gluconacetobacter entanii TaxID=108528 RepID=A0ABT3K5Q1_9PROT|nr:hypothetical protein [Gluconacetobacter entanii]MCW4590743.1 hypothetical protein [Gluconacetobacter entanii]MCW4594212.1 hypothetical protein [Gluconacetobacter entanii]NPC89028.1 hypothetical protein [Gluconacetobacter entanii]
MKKSCLAVLMSALFCGHAMAQAPTPREVAKQTGLMIARQNFTVPEYMHKTEQEGSGAVIAQRCLKAYPDDASSRQTCAMVAMAEDYRLFSDTVKDTDGDARGDATAPTHAPDATAASRPT